jgi:septum formation protein
MSKSPVTQLPSSRSGQIRTFALVVLYCSLKVEFSFAFQLQQSLLRSGRHSSAGRVQSTLPSPHASIIKPQIRETATTKLTMATTADDTSIPARSSSNATGRLILSSMQHIGGDGDTSIQLVLASQSPRRREILDMMGLGGKYSARPSPLDETATQLKLIQENISPIEYTQRLAEAKAHALAVEEATSSASAPVLYLGSDTIVELEGSILEKPKDTADAMTMLRKLSGRQHFVYTGVALYSTNSKKHSEKVALLSSFTATAKVTFVELSEEDIVAYVESGEPMDKAGSYGIQGIGGQFVSEIQGDFFTVMGLPMNLVSQSLSDAVRLLL